MEQRSSATSDGCDKNVVHRRPSTSNTRERERERQRQRQRQTETDRDRDRETETETERQREHAKSLYRQLPENPGPQLTL